MKFLTVNDIMSSQSKKQNRRNESFEHVLNLCYNTIKKSINIERNNYHCLYEVPEFIIGLPLYDLNECILFIFEKLTTNGFQAQYYFPRILYISWFPKPKPALPKPKPQSQIQSQIQNQSQTQKRFVNTAAKTTRKKSGKFILDLS